MLSAIDSVQYSVAVVGGGPAGLMAAEVLSRAGIKVDVYDAMPSVGRKFLMAGKGGLNITHSEPFAQFVSRYGASQLQIKPILERFGPSSLIDWVHDLGIKTFVGSSRRVFPEEMKAAPLLRTWLHRLRASGVTFHMRHRWTGWQHGQSNLLSFDTPNGSKNVSATGVILALGGASWPQLGSTGAWVEILEQRGVSINPLQPSNCGFDVAWSENFRQRFAGQPLKSVVASLDGITQQGDCLITEHGLEGNLIYTFSAALRDRISANGSATLIFDLAPNTELAQLMTKASKPRGGDSLANHWRKRLHLDKAKQGLIRETLSPEEMMDITILCKTIKALPVTCIAPRPIAEAISSAGGVAFSDLDENLMIQSSPGIFCAGEMLDWDAPTGGYLLTGCFASGVIAAEGMINWLNTTATLISTGSINS